MEEIIRVSAVCVIGGVMAVFLKKTAPEAGVLLALAVCVAVMLALIRPVGEILDLIHQMAAWSGVESEIFEPLLKTVGIALLCRVSTELCRDAGQNAMASLVETGGAFGAILVALPLFRAVWELLESLL
ncbi:MAG: stage III sporulation protein AD [Oscillospiraceae bacterium]|nr:stage III sporulation protein AD [Oscillospiraceae bacterium]